MRASGRVARLEAALLLAQLSALNELTHAEVIAGHSALVATATGQPLDDAQRRAWEKWQHYTREFALRRAYAKWGLHRFSKVQPFADDAKPGPPPAPSKPKYAPEAYMPPVVPGTVYTPISEQPPAAEPQDKPWNFEEARKQLKRELAQEERRERGRQGSGQILTPDGEIRTKNKRIRIYRI